jgi:hypothetical protein
MAHPHSDKFQQVFEERIKSLLEDHYCKRVDTRLPHVWVVRLKHMSNGNEILLRGYPYSKDIFQYTNHVFTHSEHFE